MRKRNDAFKFLHHFIVLMEGQAIGFGQYYCCADAEEEWYGEVQLNEIYSIDYLIGEEAQLGKGFGTGIVGLLTEAVFQKNNSKRIICSAGT
ncbi:GNAT family N-acetyltransferase [Enterococcus sp. CWB-B31]|uniref:GNAT family N-acetyltransferase n=1 Tax=Enterococcus sp. CWB-B31 TaxID=2885159 RepID=UPI001E530C5A|nr:GNAT family N-acetyltransferase [Enterococcus sp. CWB-B31]